MSSNIATNNAFDRLDACLSESFIRNPQSGILAYLGNTREGWFPIETDYIGYFYQSLLTSNTKSVGMALTDTRAHYSGSINNHFHRWIMVTLNLQGDPEMPLYTAMPQKFRNVDINIIGSSVNVNTGVDGCNICFASIDGTYYKRFNDVNQISVSDITSPCHLCITKSGYKPFLAIIGDTINIQNRTINQDELFISNKTFIGNDVTTDIPIGPVVIDGGNVGITGNKEVFIKNGTEVKIGSTLEINNGY